MYHSTELKKLHTKVVKEKWILLNFVYVFNSENLFNIKKKFKIMLHCLYTKDHYLMYNFEEEEEGKLNRAPTENDESVIIYSCFADFLFKNNNDFRCWRSKSFFFFSRKKKLPCQHTHTHMDRRQHFDGKTIHLWDFTSSYASSFSINHQRNSFTPIFIFVCSVMFFSDTVHTKQWTNKIFRSKSNITNNKNWKKIYLWTLHIEMKIRTYIYEYQYLGYLCYLEYLNVVNRRHRECSQSSSSRRCECKGDRIIQKTNVCGMILSSLLLTANATQNRRHSCLA